MRSFSAGQAVDTIVIALDPGEDVLESVNKAVAKHNIESGMVVSGIGSLSEASYHIVEPGDELPWKDTFLVKKGTIEIMAIQGMIVNFEPHLHTSLSQDDKAFGGHLEPGSKILTLGEITILKFDKKMERKISQWGFGQLTEG